MSLLSVGRHAEAAELARRSAANHAALPGWLARRGIAVHLVNEAHALAYSGRYGEARQLVEPAAEQARAANAIGAWVWFEMVLAEIARDTGRAARRSAGSPPSAGAARRRARRRRWCGRTSALPRVICCSASAARPSEALARADAVGDSPVATSFATRERTRAWLEAGRGDLVAARARLRDVARRRPARRVRTFESAVLNDLVRFGGAAEAVERLRCARRRRRRSARAAPTAATPWPSPTPTPTRCRSWSTTTKRLDVLAYAAEAAAELAELHQQRGDAAGPRRRCSARPSWRRVPAASARRRWRVAAGSSR